MDFFQTVDQMGFVERNIERIVGIEQKQALALIKIFKQAQERIRFDLSGINGESFTAGQMQITLQEIDLILNQLKIASKGKAGQSKDMVKEQSVDDLAREISKITKRFEGASRSIPVDAILSSIDQDNLLLNNFESSIDSYAQSFRDNVQRELTQSVLGTEPRISVINRLVDDWELRDWEVARIVRTELHGIYNLSKIDSMTEVKQSIIPDLKKSLFHPMDSRTGEDSKYAFRRHLVADIDKPFKYNWNGKERVFMAPPDRPNDRSILVPFREDWDS